MQSCFRIDSGVMAYPTAQPLNPVSSIVEQQKRHEPGNPEQPQGKVWYRFKTKGVFINCYYSPVQCLYVG